MAHFFAATDSFNFLTYEGRATYTEGFGGFLFLALYS